jgi:hypothetical protein
MASGKTENGVLRLRLKVRTVALDKSGATLDRLKSVRAILGRYAWLPIT